MRKNKALRMEDLTKDAPFEDVLPLITPMIKRLAFEASSVYGLEREDLEQELSLRAFLSWQSWEPGHGSKFSTYVFDVLTKHQKYLVRTAKTQRRNGGSRPISLDGMNDSSRNGHEGEYQVYDFCANQAGMDMDEYLYVTEMEESVERVICSLPTHTQPIIRSLITGKTQETVSRETGFSQSQISYYLSSFRVKLREEFEQKGFEVHLSKR